MGSISSTPSQSATNTNRMPIYSPRHVPINIPYKKTPYSKFDPELYKEKFAYPAKEPPKYW